MTMSSIGYWLKPEIDPGLVTTKTAASAPSTARSVDSAACKFYIMLCRRRPTSTATTPSSAR